MPSAAESSSGRSYEAIIVGCVIGAMLLIALVVMFAYMVSYNKTDR